MPEWDNAQAGTIFEQMLTQTGGKIDGVLAANDGLGNAAISVLKKNKLNGKVPVTGQDATVQGLQNILAGDQCMTVYKAIKEEAEAAAELAIALAKGEKKDTGQTVKDPEGNRDVPVGAADPEGHLQGQRQGRHRRRLRHQGRGLHRRLTPSSAPTPASADRRRIPRRDDRSPPGTGTSRAGRRRAGRAPTIHSRRRPPVSATPLCWNCAGSTRASVPSRCCTTSTSPSIRAR